jgi:hypothetical protein
MVILASLYYFGLGHAVFLWGVFSGVADSDMISSQESTMTRKVLFAVAILLAVALVALAADAITGKWTYEMQGRGGGGGGGGGAAATPRVVTLDLKVDGMNLTGTVLMPMGGRGGGGGGGGAAAAPAPTPITNGKVNGDSFSFEVTRQGMNGTTTTKYEGTASGGDLKLKVTAPGRGGGDPTTTEVTAKKSTT